MTQDQPDSVGWRQRQPWLAVLWRISDTGYYLGLVGAIIVPLALLSSAWRDYACGTIPFSVPAILLRAALSFLGCVILGILSFGLREYARRRGSREEH